MGLDAAGEEDDADADGDGDNDAIAGRAAEAAVAARPGVGSDARMWAALSAVATRGAFRGVRLVLKVDDDTYLHVPRLWALLRRVPWRTPAIIGAPSLAPRRLSPVVVVVVVVGSSSSSLSAASEGAGCDVK
eukprot:scaffold5595_cov220-Prasinococcus_capsulatus_cf.AAC.2